MSILIQILCDTHPAERHGCHGRSLATHGKGVISAYDAAKKLAFNSGWKQDPDIGWRCPGCQVHQKLTMPESSD